MRRLVILLFCLWIAAAALAQEQADDSVLTPPVSTRVELTADEPQYTYTFEATPETTLILSVSAELMDTRFTAVLRDEDGQLIAQFEPQVRGAAFTLEQGTGTYALTLNAVEEQYGAVLITLQLGQSIEAPASTPLADEPTTTLPPPSSEDQASLAFCNISTNATANIRATASTDAAVIGTLTRREQVGVIGQNVEGDWYAVALPVGVGWVARQVAREITPCVGLPIISADFRISTAVPTTTPTLTPSPTPTNTATRTPTVGATATRTPTNAPTDDATAEITPDVTDEVVSAANAPADEDYEVDVNVVTQFRERVSAPIGDEGDDIDVFISSIGNDDERIYEARIVCSGEGVNLLRWGLLDNEDTIACGAILRVRFTPDALRQTVRVALPQGPAFINYTLTFERVD